MKYRSFKIIFTKYSQGVDHNPILHRDLVPRLLFLLLFWI
jgi:hypothetical protein